MKTRFHWFIGGGLVVGVLLLLGAGTIEDSGIFQSLKLGGRTNLVSDDNVDLTYNGAHYQRSVPILNNLTNGIGTNLTSLLASAVQAEQTNVAAANPTATVSTSAVNGTAGTFMRSDASPAIPAAFIQANQTNDGTANWSASGTTNSTLSGAATVGSLAIGSSSTNGLAIVYPYDAIVAGAGNAGANAGQTNIEFLTVGQQYRIRQTGTIKQLELYVASGGLSNVTAFYIKVWRLNGTTYDQVGQSSNLLSSLSESITNMVSVSPGVPAMTGDYLGYRLEYSGATAFTLVSHGAASGNTYMVSNTTPATLSFGWASQTLLLATVVPISLYMDAPIMVEIGDSLIAGHTANYSFLETTATYSPLSDIGIHVASHYGWSYQNMGIGSQTSSQILARFTNDVINLHPKLAIIEMSLNDVAGTPISFSDTTNNYAIMLSACSSNGILPVILGTFPYTGGSTAFMRDIDARNLAVKSITSNYVNAVFADIMSCIGVYRFGGDAGNLWNINPTFAGADNTHETAPGYAVIGAFIASTLGTSTNSLFRQFAFPSLTAGSPGRTGLITFDGGSPGTVTALTVSGGLVTDWQIQPDSRRFVNLNGDTLLGSLLFSPDKTWNIGANGATRPALIYCGAEVVGADVTVGYDNAATGLHWGTGTKAISSGNGVLTFSNGSGASADVIAGSYDYGSATVLTPITGGTLLDLSALGKTFTCVITGDVNIVLTNATPGRRAELMVLGCSTNSTYNFTSDLAVDGSTNGTITASTRTRFNIGCWLINGVTNSWVSKL